MIIALTFYASNLFLGLVVAQVIADRIESNPHFV